MACSSGELQRMRSNSLLCGCSWGVAAAAVSQHCLGTAMCTCASFEPFRGCSQHQAHGKGLIHPLEGCRLAQRRIAAASSHLSAAACRVWCTCVAEISRGACKGALLHYLLRPAVSALCCSSLHCCAAWLCKPFNELNLMLGCEKGG
jgi:hypothetical protein